MSIWSGIARFFSNMFRGGAAARGAGEVVGARAVLTWGNAFKVAVAGGFTYLFLNGGASNVVAATLGIGQDAAQILIVFGFVVLMILVTRLIIGYVRARLDLDGGRPSTDVFRRDGVRRFDEGERGWERRRSSGCPCWQGC